MISWAKSTFAKYIISITVFWRWLQLTNVYTNGDWGYYFKFTQSELLALPYIWLSSSPGTVNLTAASYPYNLLWGLLSIPFNFAISEKIVFMIPIMVILPYGIYKLVYSIYENKIAALIGVVVYTCNTYALSIATGHLTVLMGYSLAPIVLYLYIKLLAKPRLKTAIQLSLISFLMCIYEFRIFYITAWVIFLYFIFNTFRNFTRKNYSALIPKIKFSAAYFILLLMLNTYWLLGLAMLGEVTNNSLFSRGLFGNNYMNIQQAFTLFHPFWTGGLPAIFSVQPIPIYFWLIPLLAILGILSNTKNRKVVFFGLVALLGILLTKQVDEPFSRLYKLFYDKLPGFNAFREASKFYFLIALGYSVLIAGVASSSLRLFKESLLQKTIGGLVIIVAVSLFLFNAKPLINGDIGTLFVHRNLPQSYKDYSSLIQGGYFRSLWVPNFSRWTAYDNNHPKLSLASLLNGVWEPFSAKVQGIIPTDRYITNIVDKEYFDELVDSTLVKYIAVPIRDTQNSDDIFSNYGDNRDFFVKKLDSLPWLDKIENGSEDLTLYENKNYNSYFSSLINLYAIPDTNLIDKYYSFNKHKLTNNDFSYVQKDLNSDQIKSTVINDVFEDIKPKSFTEDYKVAINKAPDTSTELKYSSAPLEVQYRSTDGKVNFISKSHQTIYENNKVQIISTPEKSDLSIDVPQDTKVFAYIEKDKALEIDINTDNNTRTLGNYSQDIPIYSYDPSGIVVNQNFETALFSEVLEDCNKYDKSPLIGMERTTHEKAPENFRYLLELTAKRHIACTGPSEIDVAASEVYYLGFDYEYEHTKLAGYEVVFNDEDQTHLEVDLIKTQGAWRRHDNLIIVPPGASKMQIRLKGYPDETNKSTSRTRYDNFVVAKTTQPGVVDYAESDVETIALDQEEISFDFTKASDHLGENLISNFSLEDGLWQKVVGDCNAYDDKPKLGMKVSKKASDGTKSLQLEAARHIACTGPDDFKLEEGKTYLLSFDYQSDNAAEAGYYMGFNDPQKNSLTERISIKGNGWNTYTKQFTVPYGTTKASLAVYSYSEDFGGSNIVTRYDNFFVKEIPNVVEQYFLVSSPIKNKVAPKDIQYTLENPTRKKVKIVGATDSFYLAMSESFHPKWRAAFYNSKFSGFSSWLPGGKVDYISDANHFKLNTWQNGWYLDIEEICNVQQRCAKNTDGSYDLDLIIEFTPQRWFYLGGIISLSTVLLLLSYLIFKRNKTQNSGDSPINSGWQKVLKIPFDKNQISNFKIRLTDKPANVSAQSSQKYQVVRPRKPPSGLVQ